MRFKTYVSASVALAASVILKALHERPNFYSACVYLGQSSACIMILTNLILLILGTILFGLQRLLYGPLRPIEIEQLYEKAWFAITETCLAMTIFRDEVGAWFIVLFVALLIGKVWGWIGEGRVEVLEQQPPADPRLFHARLSLSLVLAFIYTNYMLNYTITTVQQQARPTMMVMFAFEFAVLSVGSLALCARYGLSLREAAVIRQQTARRMQERRSQLLRDREEAKQRAEENGEQAPEFPPVDDEINEFDIDVPGWEEKGRWTFYLDLATDFMKLVLYLTFFCVLCIFYGMPIHIIRDVAITVRSFYNRVADFLKYRQATRDMNARYPDATADEISREDTCIICREPMRPWQPPETLQGEGPAPMEERLRPKKLPCGHILHFACLRSWLERQQKCPTCRQDVVAPPTENSQPNQQANGDAVPPGDQANRPALRRDAPDNRARRNRVRFFNIGPLRLGFGAGNDPQALQDEMLHQRQRRQARQGEDDAARQSGPDTSMRGMTQITAARSAQLLQMERQLRQEINSLALQQQQLRVVRQLQNEFFRLRAQQAITDRGEHGHIRELAGDGASVQGYSLSPQHQALPSGHSEIPQGVTIPEGWQLTPLVPYSPPSIPMQPFGTFQPNFGVGTQIPLPTASPTIVPPHAAPATQAFNHSTGNGHEVPPSERDERSHGTHGDNIHEPSDAGTSITQHTSTTKSTQNSAVQATIAPPGIAENIHPQASDPSSMDQQSTSPSTRPPAVEAPRSSIPQWGSREIKGSSQAPTLSSDTHISSEEHGDQEEGPDKGKGKAATVEEAVDEGN